MVRVLITDVIIYLNDSYIHIPLFRMLNEIILITSQRLPSFQMEYQLVVIAK